MQSIPELVDFSEVNDTEKLRLLDNWLCEIVNNESPSLELFENLCVLLSDCLATPVDRDFNSFLSNDLLELLVKKLLSR